MQNIILSIYVPCLDEEKNIVDSLNIIKESVKNINYEILIVDDGSKDKTLELAKKYKDENKNLNIKIMHNETNHGLGFNYYAAAYQAQGKYYMFINGSAVIPSSTIKKMLDNLGKADMVLTYFPNYKNYFVRTILSKLFVLLVNIITFNKLKYYNGPSIHLLENVKLYGTGAFGYGYQAELIAALITHKKTFIEVPVEHHFRGSGESKALRLKNILSVGRSLAVIFLNQVSYILKTILK